MMNTVIIAALSCGLIALILALMLIKASKVFKVEVDEKVETVIGLLPGANCGGCGYPGCAQFAKAVVAEKAPINGCTVGGDPTAKSLADYLGRTPPAQAEKTRAYIFCHGHKDIAKSNKSYYGTKSCFAASLVAGTKDCSYGCVGFYDCKASCNFDAIIESETGVPIIVEDKCTSCGACVKACPLKLIEIHPVKEAIHVYCKSKDKGAIARKKCDRACIGCGICVKASKEGAISIVDNLAVINYKEYSLTNDCIAKCPTKSITDERVNSK